VIIAIFGESEGETGGGRGVRFKEANGREENRMTVLLVVLSDVRRCSWRGVKCRMERNLGKRDESFLTSERVERSSETVKEQPLCTHSFQGLTKEQLSFLLALPHPPTFGQLLSHSFPSLASQTASRSSGGNSTTTTRLSTRLSSSFSRHG
jgi:hypothetical protein